MKKIGILCLLIGFLMCPGFRTEAEEVGPENVDITMDSKDLDEKLSGLEEMDSSLNKLFGDKLDFADMVKQLIRGKMPLSSEVLFEMITAFFFEEIGKNKQMLLYIVLLAVLASVLTNFTKVFEKSQTADISFFIIYLLLLAVLLKTFSVVNDVAFEVLSQMTEFMKLLMPTYMLTIASVGGAAVSVILYEFLIVLIFGINWILLNILLPMCNIYVVINLVNYISREDFLSKFSELVKLLINWGLKTLLAVVIGLNAIQGIIAPAVNSFKSGVIHKTISAIPGVGNTMNAVSEVIIGSGVLIKNGVGVGILIGIALLALFPLLKMFLLVFLYRLTAAVIQPVADKRMVQCISTAADGARLLSKCVTTAVILFFLTIAILTVSTNR